MELVNPESIVEIDRPDAEGSSIKGSLLDIVDLGKKLIAVGYRKPGGIREYPLFMESSSSAGMHWRSIQFKFAGPEIEGWLESVVDRKEQGIVAVGSRYQDKRIVPLVVQRGANEQDGWEIAQIRTGQDHVEGTLFGVVDTGTEGLVAVGSRRIEGGRNVLLIAHRGQNESSRWEAISIKEKGVPIEGKLQKIIITTDSNGLIAVGSRRMNSKLLPVIARATKEDLTQWSIEVPKLKDDQIEGHLYDIVDLDSGELVVVGSLRDGFQDHPLILRQSVDERDVWEVAELDIGGKTIFGTLFDIVELIDGGLLATGSRQIGEDEAPLVVRSFGSQLNSWEPATIMKSNELVRGILYRAIDRGDDGLISVGGMVAESTRYSVAVLRSSAQLRRDILSTLDELLSDPTITEGLFQSKALYSDSLRSFLDPLDPESQVSLVNKLSAMKDDRKSIEEDLKAMTESESKNDILKQGLNGLARLAVLGLLIYLVQIFVNLHRYYTKLASFYRARSDSLVLVQAAGTDLKDVTSVPFSDLTRALSPEDLDFGKTPKSPIQDAVEIAKELVRFEKAKDKSLRREED